MVSDDAPHLHASIGNKHVENKSINTAKLDINCGANVNTSPPLRYYALISGTEMP